MPRDANGNYTLPSGNPVISGTPITTVWANPTLQDVAAEITNSLSRDGEGGMLVPFKNQDGAVATPGITWTNETKSGFYRAGVNDMRASINGIDSFRWDANGVYIWNKLTQQFDKLDAGFQTALETPYDSVTYDNVQDGLTAALTAIGTFYNNTSSTLTATDVKNALDELAAEIDAIFGAFTFQGTWNADTNIPDLLTIPKDSGDYWVCDEAGTTDLGLDPAGNPLNSWIIGDKAVYINVTSPTPFTGFAKVKGSGDGILASQVIFDSLNFQLSFPVPPNVAPNDVQEALDFGWPLLAKVDAGYTASEIDFENGATDLSATDVQAAIEEVNNKANIPDAVTSVFARQGNIVAVAGDYNAVKISYDNALTPAWPVTEVQAALEDAYNAIQFLAGAVVLRGVWDALANVPDLINITKANGNYWIVSVEGSTVLPKHPDAPAFILPYEPDDKILWLDDGAGITGFAQFRPDVSEYLLLTGGSMLGDIIGSNALSFNTVTSNADAGNIGKSVLSQLTADLDTLINTGFFYIGAGSTNLPTAETGALIVSGMEATRATQIFTGINNGATYTRVMLSSVWTPWKEIALGDFLPLSGGTLTGDTNILTLKEETALGGAYTRFVDAGGANIGNCGLSPAGNVELIAYATDLDLISTDAINLNAPTTNINGEISVNLSGVGIKVNEQGLNDGAQIRFYDYLGVSKTSVGLSSAGDSFLSSFDAAVNITSPTEINLNAPVVNVNSQPIASIASMGSVVGASIFGAYNATLSDISTGLRRITFTTPMTNTNYHASVTCHNATAGTSITVTNVNTGFFEVTTTNATGAVQNYNFTFQVTPNSF